MRLIDADALEDYIDSDESGLLSAREYKRDYIECIDHMPTIDPVKHSRWVKMTGMMPPEHMGKHCCLECGALAPHDFGHERFTDWCPVCGSKMDAKAD